MCANVAAEDQANALSEDAVSKRHVARRNVMMMMMLVMVMMMVMMILA